jgi:SAM-dependent methyltransferase
VSGYALRAPFYRREFAFRGDFPVVSALLDSDPGLVIDVPSGAGRLLPLHGRGDHEVILVDIEPAMVAECEAAVVQMALTSRITAVQGDMRSWRAPRPATHIVVARGGLQMLPSAGDAFQAIATCAANLASGGLLYLDVGMPWTCSPVNEPDLPVFLRFGNRTELRGHDTITAGDGTLIRRDYVSHLRPERADVRFSYSAEQTRTGWRDFTVTGSWHRLDAEGLRGALERNRLKIVTLNGDYAATPYAEGAARLVCTAIRQ